jgi:hypothetical protein
MYNFPLRLPESLMEQAKTAADEDGTSANQILISLISEGLGRRQAFKEIRARAARANPDRVLELLEQFGTEPPQPGDEMPEAPSSVRPAGI